MVIWDHLLIEGSVALLKASLTILKLLRKELLKTTNLGRNLLKIKNIRFLIKLTQ